MRALLAVPLLAVALAAEIPADLEKLPEATVITVMKAEKAYAAAAITFLQSQVALKDAEQALKAKLAEVKLAAKCPDCTIDEEYRLVRPKAK